MIKNSLPQKTWSITFLDTIVVHVPVYLLLPELINIKISSASIVWERVKVFYYYLVMSTLSFYWIMKYLIN